MRIYLIGYMGCGKSTMGRRLAKHAGLKFIDMDHFIETQNRKTVPQIFAREGETEFRIKERKALEEISKINDVVIATGGGAPCFFNNMDLMNSTGVTIFLNIDPEILAARLMKSKIDRPLIKGKSKEELVEFIYETLKKRNEFYLKAHYQITRPGVDMVEVLRIIGKN